jgi:hypothetical protein
MDVYAATGWRSLRRDECDAIASKPGSASPWVFIEDQGRAYTSVPLSVVPPKTDPPPDPDLYIFIPNSYSDQTGTISCQVLLFFSAIQVCPYFGGPGHPVIKFGFRKWAIQNNWILVMVGMPPRDAPRTISAKQLHDFILASMNQARADRSLPADPSLEIQIGVFRLSSHSRGTESLTATLNSGTLSDSTKKLYSGGSADPWTVIDRVAVLDASELFGATVPKGRLCLYNVIVGNKLGATTQVMGKDVVSGTAWKSFWTAVTLTRFVTDYLRYIKQRPPLPPGEPAPKIIDCPDPIGKLLLDAVGNPTPLKTVPKWSDLADELSDYPPEYGAAGATNDVLFPRRGRLWTGVFDLKTSTWSKGDEAFHHQDRYFIDTYFADHSDQAVALVSSPATDPVKPGGTPGLAPLNAVMDYLLHPATDKVDYHFNGQDVAAVEHYDGTPPKYHIDNDRGLYMAIRDYPAHDFFPAEIAHELFAPPQKT